MELFVIEIVILDVVPAVIEVGVKLLLTKEMLAHTGEEKAAITTAIKPRKANGDRPHLLRFIPLDNLASIVFIAPP